jgi:hypothetical protein
MAYIWNSISGGVLFAAGICSQELPAWLKPRHSASVDDVPFTERSGLELPGDKTSLSDKVVSSEMQGDDERYSPKW